MLMKLSQSSKANWTLINRLNSRCSECSIGPSYLLSCSHIRLSRIKYVSDGSKLPPPITPKAAAAASLKKHSIKTKYFKRPQYRGTAQHDMTRSTPASPALGAARTPVSQTSKLTPTSALVNGKTQRLQALRTPLIHFLAARPASTKLLAQHLACNQDEILEVLQKIGKPYRLDESKWDLTDKAFKELDIWNFEYSNQEDRDLAIGRAKSAYDRMRLSTQDKLWDQLLPKQERGKGKILSNLNLHKGPIQPNNTPKIQIQQSTNDSKSQQPAGHDSDQKDRLAPSDAEPVARSKSHGPVKRTKISEKEAQTKRLLSKGPKKAISDPKPKEAHPAVKKGGAQKKSVPKSSEFVNDSDEEDGLEDVAGSHSEPQSTKDKQSLAKEQKPPTSTRPRASTPTVNGAIKIPKATESSKPSLSNKVNGPKISAAIHKVAPPMAKSAARDLDTEKHNKNGSALPKKLPEKKRVPSGASSPTSKHQGATAMQKSLSRQRNTSSPHKPSPLGSSPPTNASDFENAGASSISSTPSLAQVPRCSTTPNSASLGSNGHVQNTSKHTLKRKAGDLDSNIHDHGAPLTNGVINGLTNGHTNGITNPTKRQKTSDEDSPASGSSASPSACVAALKKAEDFKIYYENYRKQYQEISQMKEAPKEKFDYVMSMHSRLQEMKEQITTGLIGM